jgi:carbon-monoxide dehydrogenase small subunit
MPRVTLSVNGEWRNVDVEPGEVLAQTLRERLRLTGTKVGCDAGICGTCTVLVGRRPVSSCLTLTARLDGAEVLTVEGLAGGGEPHPLQRHFVEAGAVQCGFCTAGMLMTMLFLLETRPDLSEEELREQIHGNYCRCTGYVKLIEAFRRARAEMQGRARAAAGGV